MSEINFKQTPEELARRLKAKKGVTTQQSAASMRRWKERERRDEVKAICEYGVAVFYDEVRR